MPDSAQDLDGRWCRPMALLVRTRSSTGHPQQPRAFHQGRFLDVLHRSHGTSTAMGNAPHGFDGGARSRRLPGFASAGSAPA